MAGTNDRQRGVLLMALCSLLWSIGGILMKLVDWNAFALAGVRGGIAVVIIAIYMRARGMRLRPTMRSLLAGVVLSACCLSFVSANKMTTSANAIVLQFTAPVFMMLISSVFFGQRFAKSDFVTVGLTFLGIALCFVDQMDSGRMAGNLVAVLSGLFFALMFLTTGGAEPEERMTGILFGHIFTALIGLPVAAVSHTPLDTRAVVSLLVLGVFQLGIPYVLYDLAVRRCPPLYCCLTSAIEPLFNPVWVFLFDGEAPGPLALVGGVVVIATITVWSIWSGRQAEAEPPADPPIAQTPPAEPQLAKERAL